MHTLNITAASHVGCVRTNNEDMILVGDWFVRNTKISLSHNTSDADRFLIALADGMGGHNSGEIASSLVLHNLQFFFNDIPSNLRPGDFNETIYEWLESINNIVDAEGRNDASKEGMGTTLVALAYYSGDYYWLNCGDSRLYHFRNGTLRQLTSDHSLSNLLGKKEHSNIITNCIGGGCKSSYIDIVRCTGEIDSGDKLLLCSDGLSDMLDDEKIRRMLEDGNDAESMCSLAEEEGGFDNVSVAVVEVG